MRSTKSNAKNYNDMDIKITQTIPQEILENVIITALEGGSNYWYFLSDEAMAIAKRAVPNFLDMPPSEAIAKAVLEYGATIPIHDYESTDEKLGELSEKTMTERMQKLSTDSVYSYALREEMEEDGDGSTSDVVFQYMCMGEVVFG